MFTVQEAAAGDVMIREGDVGDSMFIIVQAREPSILHVLTQDALHGFAKKHRNGFTWVIVNVARGLAHKLREAKRKLAEKA